jgi:hypothetical protein
VHVSDAKSSRLWRQAYKGLSALLFMPNRTEFILLI